MLSKAKIAILVGAILAILGVFVPDLQLVGYTDMIVDLIMLLLPLFGAGVAFWVKRESVESLQKWSRQIKLR